jgi:hypothetical protein
MLRKLIFSLLLSGVILSPLGVYAMDDEGAPTTSFSRAAPSTQPDVEKVAPPFSIPGMKILDGEHLQKIGDDWVNEAGTIRIPVQERETFSPIAFEDGKKLTLSPVSHSGFLGGITSRLIEGDITRKFPDNNIWEGTHYLFIVDRSGKVPTVNAFPYINESRVPSAAPAPTLQ